MIATSAVCAQCNRSTVFVGRHPVVCPTDSGPTRGLRPSTLVGGPGEVSRALSVWQLAIQPRSIPPFTSTAFGTSAITRPLSLNVNFGGIRKRYRDVTTSAQLIQPRYVYACAFHFSQNGRPAQGHSIKGYPGGSANLQFEMVRGRILAGKFFLGNRSGVRRPFGIQPSGRGRESGLTRLPQLDCSFQLD